MLPWMLGHAPILALFFLTDIILPFLLLGTLLGWVFRAATGTGTNLYAAILDKYGDQAGWMWVIGLMIGSTVLSMSIRQIRHLQEVPSDFFRLPVFILTSTFFLMPVRFLGFLRMAHASAWGTRDGAYAGGNPGEGTAGGHADQPSAALHAAATGPASVPPIAAVPRRQVASDLSESLLADLDSLFGTAPRDIVDSTDIGTAGTGTLAVRERRTTRTAQPAPAPTRRRRHYNPKAAIPYLIAIVILALEALLYV